MPESPLYGAVELGGTKTLVAIGDAEGVILSQTTLPTRAPDSLVPEIIAFFKQAGYLAGLGIGAFGPIVLDPEAETYGCLLATNKPGWSDYDLVGAFTLGLGLPVRLMTDVGAAAMGEARLGALRQARLGVYLTVGTGIGGAMVMDGKVLPALLHPEMGHIALQRQQGDGLVSTCRFHAQCVEGLAAGPAILARFGQSLSHFTSGGAEHALVADYLGQLCANLVFTVSPHRIVLGGGVGKTPGLIPQVHSAMLRHLGGYVRPDLYRQDYICSPHLGQDAGIVGALLCASA